MPLVHICYIHTSWWSTFRIGSVLDWCSDFRTHENAVISNKCKCKRKRSNRRKRATSYNQSYNEIAETFRIDFNMLVQNHSEKPDANKTLQILNSFKTDPDKQTQLSQWPIPQRKRTKLQNDSQSLLLLRSLKLMFLVTNKVNNSRSAKTEFQESSHSREIRKYSST